MKILVVKPSSLGDVIHALPTVRVIRRAFPKAEITWLINETLVPLLEGCPIIDRVLPFPRQRMRGARAIGEFFTFARRLHEEHFDWSIDLQCLLRSGLMSIASGASKRTGLADGREGSTFFFNEVIKLPPPPTHAVDRYLMLPRQLGLEIDRVEFPLGGATSVQREKRILLNPGARWQTKRWPAARFSSLIAHLAKRFPDHRLTLIGSPDERALAESIAAASPVKSEVLAGKTKLPELIALMRRSALLITNDTGPLHMAVAVGTPTVSIFGPTDPRLTGPYPLNSPDHIVLKAAPACAPCFKSTCPSQVEIECMKNVTAEQAAEAAESLLRVRHSAKVIS